MTPDRHLVLRSSSGSVTVQVGGDAHGIDEVVRDLNDQVGSRPLGESLALLARELNVRGAWIAGILEYETEYPQHGLNYLLPYIIGTTDAPTAFRFLDAALETYKDELPALMASEKGSLLRGYLESLLLNLDENRPEAESRLRATLGPDLARLLLLSQHDA